MLLNESMTVPLGLDTLPGEVLLEILPYIKYSPHGWACLCLTCKKLNHLIKHHEHGLARDVADCQFCSIIVFFPEVPQTFDGLNVLHHRLNVLSEVHEHWLQITNAGPDMTWMRGRWEAIHKAGLLLLYRLQDCKDYDARLALLDALPATSLACLLFKLIASIKILRIYGPQPINASYARDDVLARSDVELAFEELLLLHGPDFFVAMLKAADPTKTTRAAEYVSLLHREISNMEERQSQLPDGSRRPPTLISTLRRSFAKKAECQISENVAKMWEQLSSTPFDSIDDQKMVKLVRGETIEKGFKRMGYSTP